MYDIVTRPDDSQMSTSRPVPAEEPQSNTAAPASPRSGRGRQLTARQEAKLIELCEQQKNGGRYADKTKGFWRGISDGFKHETGRTYSWQSCRRRMTKLEDESRFQLPHSPSPIQSVQAESSGDEHSATTPDRDEAIDETHDGNEGEDDDLPPVPVSVARSINPRSQYNNEDKARHLQAINDNIRFFETRLRAFSWSNIDDKDDFDNVLQAFDRFKEEFRMAVDKGKRGQEEGGQ
jgi:hypothetical protein